MMRKYLGIAISLMMFFAFQSVALAQGGDVCSWLPPSPTEVIKAFSVALDNRDIDYDRTGQQIVDGTLLRRNDWYALPVPAGATSFSADFRLGDSDGSVNEYMDINGWDSDDPPSGAVGLTNIHFTTKNVLYHKEVYSITKHLAIHVPDVSLPLYIYNASWGFPCGSGGGGDSGCTTVDDADFNVAYVPASSTDAWVNPFSDGNGGIVYALTPISGDGSVILNAYNLIAQTLDITQTNQYTITLSARAVSAEIPGNLEVGMSTSLSAVADYNSAGLSYDVLSTASRDALVSQLVAINDSTYTVYTTTLATEAQSILFLDVPKNPDGETGAVEINWVCVEASDNTKTCQNPHPVQFSFEHGTDYSSEGWSAVDYAVLDPSSHKNNMLPRWGLLNSMYDMYPGFYVSSGFFGFDTDDVTAIRYDDAVIPAAITTTVVYPKDIHMQLELFLDNGSGWYVADTAYMYNSGNVFGEFITQTIAFTLPTIYDAKPYNVALAMTVKSSLVTDAGFKRMGFDDVTLSGCFSGDPAVTGNCVLNDPELDQANGKPNELYWFGTFDPQTGSAYLSPGGVLAQNIISPQAQTYQLTMQASTFTSQVCDFSIQIRDYNSTNVIREYPVQCKPGLMQDYTIGIEIPAQPVEFSVHQNNGDMQIQSLCLTTPTQNCLNKNPLFLNGTSGYVGDFTVTDGAAIVQPQQSLAATGVQLSPTRAYQLQMAVSPATTGTVLAVVTDDGLPPTINSGGVTVSGTTTITHTFNGSDIVANAPALWNFNTPYDDEMKVTDYCITEITSTVYYGGKNCTTIDNADFDNGLQGWTANNVTGVGGYAVFGGAGGSLLSTVVHVSDVTENLVTNPSFEINFAGWAKNSSDKSATITRSETKSSHGNASMLLQGNTSSWYYAYQTTSIAVANGESITVSADIYAGEDFVYLRINDGPNVLASTSVFANGEWVRSPVTWTNNTGASVNVQIRISCLTASPYDIYIDGVQATKTPAEQTYHDGDDDWCQWTGTPHASTTKCGYPFDATVHIIGKSPTTTPVNATVTISSTGSTTTTTHTFGYGMTGDEYFDNYQVGGGDMQVSINADAGFELDYICVIPGDFTEPGEPGTGGGIEIGSGHCAPPPMSILGDLPLSGWLDGIWIWDSATPSNAEIVQAYSAGWLRYIGCTQTEIGQMVEEKLDTIIARLNTLITLQGIDTLASVISAISDSINLLEQTIDDLINTLVDDGISLAAILAALLLFFGALMSVLALIIGLLYLFWMIPQEFWTSLWGSIHGSDAVMLPLPTSPDDPLHNIYVGFQLFNQTIAPTWLFTITVIVIALGSISLIWWTVNRIQIKW